MTQPEPYMQIPVSEFEYLHQEIVRLRAGWSDAEAQIAVLSDEVREQRREIARLREIIARA